MRAGRLKTRRYKIHPLRGAALLLTGVLLGAGAYAYLRGGIALPISVPARQPAAAGQQKDVMRAETTLTLPAETWFALQVGAFDTKNEAEAQAAGFRGRGAAGYVFQSGAYRVLAAAYTSRSDAQRVQAQLKNRHQVESAVVEITRPEITFRLSGTREHLDTLRDALDALYGAAGQLGALSASLDQGETGREQALAALRSEKDTVAALRERLVLLFPDTAHPAVAAIIGMLTDLDAALADAVNAASQSALGARIKYGQLLCACRLADFAQSQK